MLTGSEAHPVRLSDGAEQSYPAGELDGEAGVGVIQIDIQALAYLPHPVADTVRMQHQLATGVHERGAVGEIHLQSAHSGEGALRAEGV